MKKKNSKRTKRTKPAAQLKDLSAKKHLTAGASGDGSGDGGDDDPSRSKRIALNHNETLLSDKSA